MQLSGEGVRPAFSLAQSQLTCHCLNAALCASTCALSWRGKALTICMQQTRGMRTPAGIYKSPSMLCAAQLTLMSFFVPG